MAEDPKHEKRKFSRVINPVGAAKQARDAISLAVRESSASSQVIK